VGQKKISLVIVATLWLYFHGFWHVYGRLIANVQLQNTLLTH